MDALLCAIACQRALTGQPWTEAIGRPSVRMALYTGDVSIKSGEYHGQTMHRANRLLLAGHGEQILCSEATAILLCRDLEPQIRLKDLGLYRLREMTTPERIFQVDYPEMAKEQFPAITAEAGYVSYLPLQLTRFFDREKEIGSLTECLLQKETHLVTLTGPGGCGKTRLALEVARRLTEFFQGSVWFASMADLWDARLMLQTVLEFLKVPRLPHEDLLDQVVQVLSDRPSLLVLDNLEHLVAEGSGVILKLLERLPDLKCLVTSRQRLEVAGEQELRVHPLPTPQDEDILQRLTACPSVQLFVERAQAVRPDFDVTTGNIASVAALCQRLEGIPLALELAASRIQVVSLAQMLTQLEHRFDFLVSRRRDVTPRHRTLR